MTINPADIHSRITLYFAGIDLDLDKVLPQTIPYTYERAQIIAAHPVSTARFFHVLISNILTLMVEKGVLGPTKAYFGTVENQGRGSLHLHILIWLDHELTPSQLKESSKDESFRKGLLNYLEDIIKEDLSKFTPDVANRNGRCIYCCFASECMTFYLLFIAEQPRRMEQDRNNNQGDLLIDVYDGLNQFLCLNYRLMC